MISHYGIYGYVIETGRLLLVQKSRGPYTGMFDLPGGAPVADENRCQTLAREFHEELGVSASPTSDWFATDFIFSFEQEGKREQLAHHALCCHAKLESSPNLKIADTDVAHAKWIYVNDLPHRTDISPLVLNTLETALHLS